MGQQATEWLLRQAREAFEGRRASQSLVGSHLEREERDAHELVDLLNRVDTMRLQTVMA